ncbi:MAG: glycosyltransferase, partial [Candidatus Acidiferrum sp.]
VPLDAELAATMRGTINLLFVGRVSPHKGHKRLLRVASLYKSLYGTDVRLTIVGGLDDQLGIYYRELRKEIAARRLDGRVFFTGKVTPSQLKTFYKSADVFLCVSEHEGFCVPLVEAMRLGVPIVAYADCAVGSTLGEHPFCWKNPDPFLAAESIREILENREVRAQLIRFQHERYNELYTPRAIGQRFEQAINRLLPTGAADSKDAAHERRLQFA